MFPGVTLRMVVAVPWVLAPGPAAELGPGPEKAVTGITSQPMETSLGSGTPDTEIESSGRMLAWIGMPAMLVITLAVFPRPDAASDGSPRCSIRGGSIGFRGGDPAGYAITLLGPVEHGVIGAEVAAL